MKKVRSLMLSSFIAFLKPVAICSSARLSVVVLKLALLLICIRSLGEVENARKVFKDLAEQDLVVFNVVTSGYANTS